MKLSALEQANIRLERAKIAQQILAGAKYFDEAEPAWTDFLLATSTIYSKLEQGAKGCGQSEAWFGRRKGERRTDEVLRYLHFARNADEHGLAAVTEQGPQNFGLDGEPLAFGEIIKVKAQPRHEGTMEPWGPEIPMAILGPHLVLLRVVDDRFGDFCDPPTSHKGKVLDLPHPIYVSEVAIEYLAEMLSDAVSLPEH